MRIGSNIQLPSSNYLLDDLVIISPCIIETDVLSIPRIYPEPRRSITSTGQTRKGLGSA